MVAEDSSGGNLLSGDHPQLDCKATENARIIYIIMGSQKLKDAN
jgi:hypothetical protein